MCRRAFTLIELLVVITILSILLSLLMPGVVAARRQAWATNCCHNLKQLGEATVMYAINHQDHLPGVGDYTGTQFFGYYAGADTEVDFSKGYLSPYMDNVDGIWQCPSFAHFLPRADGPCSGYAYNYHYLTEFGDNGLGWFDPDYKWWYHGLSASVIKKHSRTVLFGDSARNWMGPLQENWYWTPPSEGLPWGSMYTHFRHRRRANVATHRQRC